MTKKSAAGILEVGIALLTEAENSYSPACMWEDKIRNREVASMVKRCTSTANDIATAFPTGMSDETPLPDGLNEPADLCAKLYDCGQVIEALAEFLDAVRTRSEAIKEKLTARHLRALGAMVTVFFVVPYLGVGLIDFSTPSFCNRAAWLPPLTLHNVVIAEDFEQLAWAKTFFF